jgi:phage terminase large subunit-like protein
MQEAQSGRIREKVTSTYRGAIIPRMGPHTKLVWIQTLWHESETIQDVLANEGDDWEVIRIPAIADAPDDPLGRPIGEPMVSARGDRDWAKIRRDVGEYVFSALYQQRPARPRATCSNGCGGGTGPRRPRWRVGERIDLGGRIWPLDVCWRFLTGDLAASTKTSADWTVAAAWALTDDGDLVLLDLVRARVGEADHFDLFRPLAQRWRVDTALHREVVPVRNDALAIDATNAACTSPQFDAGGRQVQPGAAVLGAGVLGRVWLPANAHWAGDFVAEHAAFPNGSHDDMVDTGSFAVRVAVTKWQPPAPRTQPDVGDTYEMDYLTVAM